MLLGSVNSERALSFLRLKKQKQKPGKEAHPCSLCFELLGFYHKTIWKSKVDHIIFYFIFCYKYFLIDLIEI